MSQVVISSSTRWPVTLRAGAVVLRALARWDELDWDAIRRVNRKWLEPWDATIPPEAGPNTLTFLGMLKNQREMGRQGRGLPWALAWDDGWPDRPSSRPKLIGQVTIGGITWGSARYGYIGYWIDQRFAGRGLVPLGVALACDYCFSVLGLHRLEIDILPENERSHRVAEKVGFTPDGRRQSLLHINGVWREHDAFVMTNDQAPPSLTDRVLGGRAVPSGPLA